MAWQVRLLGFLISVGFVSGLHAATDPWLEQERAREHFLCEWKGVHVSGHTRALDFCGNPDLDIGLSLVQQDGFWGDQPRSLKLQFEAEWASSPVKAELQAQVSRRRQAEEQRLRAEATRKGIAEAAERAHLAAEQKMQFGLAVAHMGNKELCVGLHDNGYESARAELQKRNVFTSREWQLIASNKIAIGISETALICSWGRTRAHRTLTAHSEHLQYVYDSGTFVYVENGAVISIQDTQ